MIPSHTYSSILQGIATGKSHGAIMTNSEPWEAKAVQAGRKSGDLLAPIVYCPELHFSEFASAVADMKNSAAVSIKPEGTKEKVYKKRHKKG